MNSLNLPGGLLAAAAASFAKGQEVSKDASTDAKERLRQARQIVFKNNMLQQQEKTQESNKGFLA